MNSESRGVLGTPAKPGPESAGCGEAESPTPPPGTLHTRSPSRWSWASPVGGVLPRKMPGPLLLGERPESRRQTDPKVPVTGLRCSVPPRRPRRQNKPPLGLWSTFQLSQGRAAWANRRAGREASDRQLTLCCFSSKRPWLVPPSLPAQPRSGPGAGWPEGFQRSWGDCSGPR